jgi:PTH1 family peptidyl-tRNA hydrolase
MRIIVGLGNPGFSYRRTRHNLGFMVVNALAEARGMRFRRGRLKGSVAEGAIGKEEVVLVRPLTFMNLSGQCVAAVVKHYQCPLSDLLVVCDDVNLDLGRIRLRRSGSAGGHNGLTSIIKSLHSQAFARLRLGIGAAPEHMDMMTYVLSPFRRSEWPTIHDMISRATLAVETWVYHGVEEAMNRFNA